jgi:hypothetical protein
MHFSLEILELSENYSPELYKFGKISSIAIFAIVIMESNPICSRI